MSLIVPDSTVNLYADVPISAGHQLVFKSRSTQNTYFLNKRLVTKAGCSYIRKTGRLRIEFNAARVQQCNYMSFTNASFENVTFYAQIMDFEYVNNETTDIIYSIDWWQTYMFDADYHACSILREHLTESDFQKAEENPWRRDIPELLTDEGLPVGKPLEKLYTETSQSSILPDVYSGERFRVPDVAVAGNLHNRTITFFVSAFDYNSINNLNGQAMPEFMTFWDSINNITENTTWETLFTTWNNGFVRSYGMFTINYDFNPNWQTQMNNALEWFAKWGVTSAIIGIYVLPLFILQGLGESDGRLIHVNLSKLNVVNSKLNTYPFRYIRVISPLDTKEYRIDLFSSASNSDSDSYVEFRLLTNCNGLPTMAIVPINYGYKLNLDFPSGSVGYLNSLNYNERIEFKGFAQAGFSIDSYLTYLSAQYSSALMSNTSKEAAAHRAGGVRAISDIISPIISAVSGLAGGNFSQSLNKLGGGQHDMQFNNAPNFSNTGAGGMLNKVVGGAADLIGHNQYFDVIDEATSKRTGSSAVFDGTKGAFVNDNYTAGSSDGLLAYQLRDICFIFEIVTLNDDVLQKYDDYLTCYGYKSLRAGKPHICDYVKEGTNIPHFSQFDGETFTYVQTENMHVSGVQQVACNYIENLFNSGCRFLKGD